MNRTGPKNPRNLGYDVLVVAAKLNLSGKAAERKEKVKMLGHEAADKEGGAVRLKGKSETVRGLISGLVAQSELTPLLDEIYGGSNDLLNKRRLRTGEKGGPKTVEELIDIKSRRRRGLQEPCSHINSIEVEQIKGAVFGDVYVANCLDCGVLGPLQTTIEEAQKTLQRLGSQQQLGDQNRQRWFTPT